MQSVWRLSYSEVWSECHHFSVVGLNPPETAPRRDHIAPSRDRHCRFTTKTQWEMSRSAGIAQKYARSRFMRCVVMLYRRTWGNTRLWGTDGISCESLRWTALFWRLLCFYSALGDIKCRYWEGRPMHKLCTRSVPLLPDSSFSWQISMEMV